MTRIGMVSLLCAGLLVTGCNRLNHKNEAGDRSELNGAAGTTGNTGDRSVDKAREFVLNMIADGTHEVQVAHLAEQHAQSADVKQFASMMIKDHTKAGDELKAIAAKDNIQGSTNLEDTDHQKTMERLSKLNGAEFDRAYMDSMVDDHQHAIDELQKRADEQHDRTAGTTGSATPKGSESGLESEVNQWAANALPTVRMHLDRAKEIKDHLGSGMGDKMKSVMPKTKKSNDK